MAAPGQADRARPGLRPRRRPGRGHAGLRLRRRRWRRLVIGLIAGVRLLRRGLPQAAAASTTTRSTPSASTASAGSSARMLTGVFASGGPGGQRPGSTARRWREDRHGHGRGTRSAASSSPRVAAVGLRVRRHARPGQGASTCCGASASMPRTESEGLDRGRARRSRLRPAAWRMEAVPETADAGAARRPPCRPTGRSASRSSSKAPTTAS